jgi:hypothetical protein
MRTKAAQGLPEGDNAKFLDVAAQTSRRTSSTAGFRQEHRHNWAPAIMFGCPLPGNALDERVASRR